MGGDIVARETLVKGINRAFNAAHIKNSATRVKKLSPRADFLDISEALGVLAHLHIDNFRRYRKRLTIPPLIQRVLTITFRDSLFHAPNPIPMHIEINPGRSPSVKVKTTDQLISVVLTRPDPPVGHGR